MVAIPASAESAEVAPLEQLSPAPLAYEASGPTFSIFSPDGTSPPEATRDEPADPLADQPPTPPAESPADLPAEPSPEVVPPVPPAAPEPPPKTEAELAAEKEADAAAKKEAEAARRAERIVEAEREYLDACCERDRIETEISSLKSCLKLAKECTETTYTRLLSLRSGDPTQLDLPIVGDADDDDDLTDEADEGDVESVKPAAEPATPVPSAADEKWRSVAITEIDLEGIEGLGDKKRERLIDEVPTIGDLEDLRSKAAMANEPPHKLMPKGIGAKSADVIVERLLTWLGRNRDQEAFAEATEHSPGTPEPLADDHEKQVISRARELAALSPRPSHDYGAIFEDGATAARNDCPVTDCGWTADSKQDSWLLGWLSEKELPA